MEQLDQSMNKWIWVGGYLSVTVQDPVTTIAERSKMSIWHLDEYIQGFLGKKFKNQWRDQICQKCVIIFTQCAAFMEKYS